jgi:hypothetical protein
MGILLIQQTHDSEVTELVPASSGKFFVEKGPDVQFEFKLSPTGEIVEAWFVYYSLKKKMIKTQSRCLIAI